MTYHLDKPAMIAAAQASEAVTELLRFCREGPANDLAFGEIEVCLKLAEALVISIDIHLGQPNIRQHEGEFGLADLDHLRASAARYIAGLEG